MRKKTSCIIISFAALFLSVAIFAQQQLIFAVTVTRHGDRTPYAKMDSTVINFNQVWPEGAGILMPEGMRQEYSLGTRLRDKYIETLKLLPKEYKDGSMYVIATDYQRTFVSAECVLMGLYPMGTGPLLNKRDFALPHGFQPIQIHTATAEQQKMIKPEVSDPDTYNKLIEKYSFAQPEWKDKEKAISSDLDRWNKLLGVNMTALIDVLVPGDNVYCITLHNKPLPREFTSEDAKKISDAKSYVWALRAKPKELGKFLGGPFLENLKNDMNLAAKGKQKYKYIIYSGHDNTICGIMSGMGTPLEYAPPYASHLDYELYKDGSEYYVKIYYNDHIVKLTAKDECTLQEFCNAL